MPQIDSSALLWRIIVLNLGCPASLVSLRSRTSSEPVSPASNAIRKRTMSGSAWEDGPSRWGLHCATAYSPVSFERDDAGEPGRYQHERGGFRDRRESSHNLADVIDASGCRAYRAGHVYGLEGPVRVQKTMLSSVGVKILRLKRRSTGGRTPSCPTVSELKIAWLVRLTSPSRSR